MKTLWSVSSASILGRDHAALRRNRQDAAASGVVGDAAFGVVADGCGQGGASEVGAALTVAIARSALERALRESARLDGVGARVAAAVVSAFADLAAHLPDREARRALIREQLLATVVGFAVDGDRGCLFAMGDGAFLVDDEVVVLECDNRPGYPAYDLCGGRVALVERPVHSVSVIGVATDGVDEATLRRASLCTGTKLSRELLVLQRAGALADDGSVAIARRTS